MGSCMEFTQSGTIVEDVLYEYLKLADQNKLSRSLLGSWIVNLEQEPHMFKELFGKDDPENIQKKAVEIIPALPPSLHSIFDQFLP